MTPPRALAAFLLVCSAPLSTAPSQAPGSEEALLKTIAVTRWADPATRPETYEEWRAARAGRETDGPFLAELAYRSPAGIYASGRKLDVLLHESLKAALQARIDEYIRDVEIEGWAVSLFVCGGGSPAELRGFLKQRFAGDGLAGCLLVGDLPVAWYEMYDDFDDKYSQFPCDLYYMDLDGTFEDADKNAKFDAHTASAAGDQRPEIFVGRITAAPLAGAWGTEAGLAADYLRKVHAFRTGALSAPRRALAFQDDDWYTMATYQERAYSTLVRVTDKATTTAANYKARLLEGYESVLVCSHSSPSVHTFKIPNAAGDSIANTAMWQTDPPALFYNLFACSNARFTSSLYYGGTYLFNRSGGLIAVGSTKTGSMLNFSDYYGPLGAGECFGEALRSWFAKRYPYSLTARRWFYGMTLLGDPTLRLDRSLITISRNTATPAGLDLALALESRRDLSGRLYLFLASLSGTAPGFGLAGLRVPLNPDAATELLVMLAGAPAFPAGLGWLDAQAKASARLTLAAPLPPGLLGLPLSFSAVLIDQAVPWPRAAVPPAAIKL